MIEVYLNDKNLNWDQAVIYFEKADKWAQNNCPSYRGHHVQDVTDVSYIYDQIAQYIFENEKDVVLFRLKWC